MRNEPDFDADNANREGFKLTQEQIDQMNDHDDKFKPVD